MNWETIKSIYYYVLIHNYKIEYLGGDKYKLTSYYPSGKKCLEIEYKNRQYHGKDIGWWKNGQKSWKHEYKNGQLHGESISWDEDGLELWKEKYQNGKLIK